MRINVSYVNFHGKRYVDINQLVELIRAIGGGGQVTVDLDKLVEWIEKAEYPEQTQ
jgi:hypothetical protein